MINNKQINYEYNMKKAEEYVKEEKYLEAIKIYSRMFKVKNNTKELIELVEKYIKILSSKSKKEFNKSLDIISIESSPLNNFPIYWRFYLDKQGKLTYNQELFIFKFLTLTDKEYNPFICIKNNSFQGIGYETCKILNDSNNTDMHLNIKAEIINSKLSRNIKVEKNKIIPIAATSKNQLVNFKFDNKEKSLILPPYEYQFINVDKNLEINSKKNLVIGKPIKLIKDKKIVIDIFIDTLSYKFIKDRKFIDIPNIYNFFKDGVIFDKNYSIGEYTRPVVSGIRTGLNTRNNGMFNDKVNTKLEEDMKTTAEYFKENGYYTCEFSSDVGQPHGNQFKGIDRVILQHGNNYSVNNIISDAIEHIDAFKDYKNYVRISILDLHRAIDNNINRNIDTRINASLDDLFEEEEETNSVFKKGNKYRVNDYISNIRKVDRELSNLFKYINENYSSDQYVISLVSDHGAMMLNEDEFLLKDIHTNTALMLKGNNVPKANIVDNEVTSVIDLYAILPFLAGIKIENNDACLPKIFNGIGREYAVSESLYPGQTYKACVRDLSSEIRLETEKETTYDGLVDFNSCNCKLYNKKMEQIDYNLDKYLKIINS